MPAYTFVSAGTVVTSSSGAVLSPVGSAVSGGNLLLLMTGQRGNGGTITDLAPDWTKLGEFTTGGSLNIWGRVASGTSADEPSVDWSATNNAFAWIEQYSGDVYTDMASIVAHIGTGSANQTALTVAAATITTDDCLLLLLSRKNCAAANATTFTAPGSFTKRQTLIANTNHWAVSGSWQQTTATSVSVSAWTDDDTTDEVTTTNSLVLALKTATVGGGGGLVLPTMDDWIADYTTLRM